MGDMHWPGDPESNVSAADKPGKAAASASVGSSFMPTTDSNSTGFGGHGVEGAKEAMPEILTRISNIASGKDKDYMGLAKSFATLVTNNYKEQDEVMQQPQSTSPSLSPSFMQAPSDAGASTSGSISGSTPEMLDPRGALNPEIVAACTSPLFL